MRFYDKIFVQLINLICTAGKNDGSVKGKRYFTW